MVLSFTQLSGDTESSRANIASAGTSPIAASVGKLASGRTREYLRKKERKKEGALLVCAIITAATAAAAAAAAADLQPHTHIHTARNIARPSISIASLLLSLSSSLLSSYHGLSRASSSATRWSFSRSAARSLATILNCGAEKAANGEPLLPLSSPSVGDKRPGDASTMVGSDSATEAIVPYVVVEAWG